MSLKELSDEECVLLAQTGNYDTLTQLCVRYQKYSYRIAFEFFSSNRQSGITVDELVSVAQETIIIAVKNFSNNIHLFYPYWRAIATNAMIKYNQQNSYFHHAKTFNGISLNQNNAENFSNDQILGEPDFKIEQGNVEDTFLKIVNDPKNGFSKNERMVMNLIIGGFGLIEIMKMLDWSKAQLYYAFKNGKKKMATFTSCVKS